LQANAEEHLHDHLRRIFGCAPEVAAIIGARASDRAFPVRATLLRQGDTPEETYLLLTGRAQALLYGMDGQLVMLHEFGAGDIFGAVDHADRAPHEADIVAVEKTRAAVFLALDFLHLMETQGCVGLAVSRMLLRQLRAATGRMVERLTLSAAGRVYAELLRLARLGDGRSIRPAPVLAGLAVRIHTTRETVSRTISALERRGILRREDDGLVIVAPHRLEEMVV
jgi:CRP/FNR family cyclic AMP-dependent transcriptional regulator